MHKVKLPYFDLLFQSLDRGNTPLDLAFGRHVHWGYWKDPRQADRSPEDFANAAERLSQKVWRAALLKPGMSVLDAGCGFGGTLASMNENLSDMHLVGLNIDSRQIERAERKVVAKSGNAIEFRLGDACAMPFAPNSFDAALAVECIFHFPSRETFFAEAHRVLKPGGILSICDFVPRAWVRPFSATQRAQRALAPLFGSCQMTHDLKAYRKLARHSGFLSLYEEDITRNTVPTYPFLRSLKLTGDAKDAPSQWGSYAAEWMTRLGWMRYMILAFQKIG